MNKKQLLSIAMLLSVAGMQAMTMDEFIAEGARVDAQVAADKAKYGKFFTGLAKRHSQASVNVAATQTPVEVATPGMFSQAWTATKNGAGYAWETAKVAPFVVYNSAKSGAVKTWETAKTVPAVVKNGASNVYTFAKANPTTFGVRTGAVAGAGYVAYRNAGKVWNKIKENPKTTAALVAAGVLGYYKGDVALAAAKAAFAKLPATPESVTNAASIVASYVPSTPEFAKTATSTVASYVPATPEFAKTAAKVIASNPYTSAAYVAAGAQGIADYVGLAGSQEDDETATEVVTCERNKNLFTLKKSGVIVQPAAQGTDIRIKLQETRNWCVANNAAQFIPAIDAKLAELA